VGKEEFIGRRVAPGVIAGEMDVFDELVAFEKMVSQAGGLSLGG
jgi:hypothetical protein